MITAEERNRQFGVYKNHVARYEQEFRKRNRLPKNHDWRPYRWCSKDIVFCLTVVKQERAGNLLKVDVCLIANPPQYVDHSGAKVALGFLLSEAYKCGTSMEIAFTQNVEGGRVPSYICDYAIDIGIDLKYALEGRITPFEARQLYLELAGFSKAAQERIMRWSVEEVLTPERVCFMVMGGIWSLPEAEAIILGSESSQRLLLCTSAPEDRAIYLGDIQAARAAILGSSLERKLQKKDLWEGGKPIESEDEEVDILIGFDPVYYAKVYRPEEEIAVPWIGEDLMLGVGTSFVVAIRARTSTELVRYFDDDRTSLSALKAKYQDATVFLLVARDFKDIPEANQLEMRKVLQAEGIRLMVAPVTIASLDREAMRRLETGKVIRR